MTGRATLGERVAGLAPIRYVIAFAARSGSTLLCADLEAAGLGHPTEHFQPYLRGSIRAATHLQEVVQRDAPVFGTKLAWEQACVLLRTLADEGEDVPTLDLRHAFGADVRVVLLTRRNKVRQAISAWRAATTRQWHDTTGAGSPSPEPDLDAIVAVAHQFLAEDWLWARLLSSCSVDTLTVAYEDLVADRAGWIRRVATHVAGGVDGDVRLTTTLHQMADRWTDRVEALVLERLGAPTHPFWTAPSLAGTVLSSPAIERPPLAWPSRPVS